MVVGICTIELRLLEARTLKDKRRVVKGLLDRVRQRYQVAAAEVDHLDSHILTTIGIACVSNASRHADEILAAIIRYVEGHDELEVLEYHTEVL